MKLQGNGAAQIAAISSRSLTTDIVIHASWSRLNSLIAMHIRPKETVAVKTQ